MKIDKKKSNVKTYQPAQNTIAHPIEKLIWVMACLRDPDGGCPWDLEQDFTSIAPYTIEEAYEVAEAINTGDRKALCEELGDLLLQSVYHAQMAAEEGSFDFEDVINGITEKMIHRHPHVFGDYDAKTAEDVNVLWDERKAMENEKGTESVLDDVPHALPALLRAEKLQKRAAKVGFEWPDLHGVLDKFEEEIAEMREALDSGAREQQLEEFGDLLFVLVNFGRMTGHSAENALRQCNDKFERRFKGMEETIKSKMGSLVGASLDQMEQEWQRQKIKEKS